MKFARITVFLALAMMLPLGVAAVAQTCCPDRGTITTSCVYCMGSFSSGGSGSVSITPQVVYRDMIVITERDVQRYTAVPNCESHASVLRASPEVRAAACLDVKR